jgi:hypothetical protein
LMECRKILLLLLWMQEYVRYRPSHRRWHSEVSSVPQRHKII